MNIEKVNVLGVGLSAINLHSAVEAIATAVKSRTKGYICVTGVHGVMEAQDDPAFRDILNGAFLNTPDGMPMVWMGKIRGEKEMSRVYGPDLMLDVFEWSAQSGCSHFFYGGQPGVPEQLKRNLEEKFPGVKICGFYSPPFRPLNADEERMLADTLEKLRPDIVWVGLSTPKQEKFMAQYLAKMNTTLMIGVGAAFDFHAGRARQAPRWIQRSGFEWLYRLTQEPGRLWKRYLRNNPRFVVKIAEQLTGLKKYSIH